MYVWEVGCVFQISVKIKRARTMPFYLTDAMYMGLMLMYSLHGLFYPPYAIFMRDLL